MSTETTLESIINDLDNRGLMVLQVLLGQQAMKLLALETPSTKTRILKPMVNV